MKPLFFLLAAGLLTAAAPLAAQQTTGESPAASLSSAKNERDNYRPKFGLKGGYNIAKVKGTATNYAPDNRKGFMVAAFYSTPSRGLGYRTELVFSRQGFSFDEDGKLQEVTQDYIYLPNFTTFTIAQKVMLQAGAQIGYLLNAEKKSSSGTESDIKEYMNRLDYGFAGGVEMYPFKGLLVGARYNVSLGSVYKQYESAGTSPMPVGYPFPFTPNDIKGRNAVVQFFAGYRF